MTTTYRVQIKAITGNGHGSVKIVPPPGKRLHGINITSDWSAGTTATDTVAEQLALITEVRVLVGSTVRRRISGAHLQDYCLLNGATYAFTIASGIMEFFIPFAEDWFLASVADALAWNPAILGGAISVEMDITAASATYPTLSAVAEVSDDLNAPSPGIITWDTLSVVAAGTSFVVESNVLRPVGSLVQATIYPSSGAGTVAITPVTLYVGPDDRPVHEGITAAENDLILTRATLTPRNTSRITYQYNYDLVAVRGDALSHAIDLTAGAKLKIQGATALSGTCPIVLARLEAK